MRTTEVKCSTNQMGGRLRVQSELTSRKQLSALSYTPAFGLRAPSLFPWQDLLTLFALSYCTSTFLVLRLLIYPVAHCPLLDGQHVHK